ncbi:hypothetical protein BOV90_03775 [Solemya velum gill symbiont]|uniref:DUF1223 domain-containing protein n=1 Tax=Solemya velum gill symbiont TaxID=2340 RepID=A0A1T2CR80_SOVGS|nr:DUF1223 domain-containing protein [Solemya velum gill symbiont]OOY34556.1 hypothetical protein BOV88_09640 [Solemya velum gill symbiont]OOY37271.1 hypothetical protein BOV89_08480 [Solemya velum gill symbiont]OOY40502.1 hypothetical protein BOV90_03775 [Solemya velum gill symbiont]OOY43299.1 hypothetical protein BOV91_04420 [Solemya velum gill symbiont]OOY44219.1 hypothetical protein BOV92_09260 [Solemya velum gill symbiont]
MKLSRILISLIALFLFAQAEASEKTYSSGEQQVALLELFTSQGCSSCPPADKWVNQLIDRPGLWRKFIPVSFHVDYWDYIGWKDPYASRSNLNRQYRYKQQKGVKVVYTPGFVVNGKEWRDWRRNSKIPQDENSPGNLEVKIDGQRLQAKFIPVEKSDERYRLTVVLLGFDLSSRVTDGENEGRTLKEEFVVLDQASQLSHDSNWDIQLPWLNTASRGKRGVAAWVATENRQAPVQATGGWLNQ